MKTEMQNAAPAQLRTTSVWDENFFRSFISVKNKIYQNHTDYISEEVDDLKLYFGEDTFFSKKMTWHAVLIENVGRYLLSMQPGGHELYLGYFECFGDEKFLREQIFADIKMFQKKFPQLRLVKGPIQGSLFAGYRFREFTTAPRFLGESLHQDFYPSLWQAWGFKIDEYWDSYSFITTDGCHFYQELKSKFQGFWKDPKLIYRGLNMKKWDQEIQIIYEITMEAYDLKGTNHEIDFKTFKILSEKMKPILKPDLVNMLEYNGQIVAFTICYPDIQSSVRNFNQRKCFLPKWLNKALLMLQIYFCKHPLLLVYVAKRKNCPVKWAMAKLACGMAAHTDVSKYPISISALNAESSGSRASLPANKSLHSRHFLMSLSLT